MSSLDRSSNFFIRNKTAIAITALASASAIGAYYYYSQSPAADDASAAGAADAASKKKKKNRKSKKKANDDADSSSAPATSPTASPKWPVGADGFPDISDETIEALSDKERDAWALALKEDGNAEFKAKKYHEAIRYYTAALQCKVDPVFYSNRSACYAALNDHHAVIEDTTSAINIKRDYPKCVLRRATSYEILENYTDAMFDLTALTIHGGFSNKSVEQVLERVLKKHSVKIVEKDMESLHRELPSASTIGAFFGAFLAESSPAGVSDQDEGADKFLFDAIAQLNENTQDGYDNADTLFNQAVQAYEVDSLTADSENAPKASIALEYAAAFKFLKNDPKAAIEDIEKAIALKPRARTYVYRALMNADKHSFVEAIADFDHAKKLEPENADSYYHLGQLHYLTGNLTEAQENFEKAKEYNPANVYCHIQLACIAYKLGNFEEAEAKFKAAKAQFPTSPEVPNYYGEILADKGDIDAACKQFETAARLQEALPTFSIGALPLINKASLITKQDFTKLADAQELLQKACALDSRSEMARITLAQIQLQVENVDEAIELFEASSRLARTFDEKVQATSFAEATKMQKRIRADPYLSGKIAEMMSSTFAHQ